MKPATVFVFAAGLLLSGMLSQAQTPPTDPALRSSVTQAIQHARALKKAQEAISSAITAHKASSEQLAPQIAATENSLKALRESIEKIDERYDKLSETHQAAVREAWSLTQLFTVFIEYMKEAAAKADSPERERDLISHVTSTTRRAAMLDETLTRLSVERRGPRGS